MSDHLRVPPDDELDELLYGCDWGFCDREPAMLRRTELGDWLPVCWECGHDGPPDGNKSVGDAEALAQKRGPTND